MLADFEIRKAIETGRVGIRPFNEDALQPVSYDLTLHHKVRVPDPFVSRLNLFNEDPDGEQWPHPYTKPVDTDGLVLRPGDFILASTRETVHLDPSICGKVEGKSSLGRIGLAIHITAGFIDPGFVGQITLEIKNMAPWEIPLKTGMKIAQITFEQVSVPERDYSKTGSYCGQQGPTESRYKPWG
jgi:dCTP deaminase